MYTKKNHKWIGTLIAFIVMLFTCMSSYTVYAEENGLEMEILDAEISSSGKLQPNQSFSIDVELNVKSFPDNYDKETNGKIYITDAYVSGAISSKSEPKVQVEGSEEIDTNACYTVKVTGLYYDGSGDTVTVSIGAKSKEISAISDSKQVKVSGYSADELAEGLTVDESNIVVKNGETQSVSVKVTNEGKININSVEATLSLSQKVTGLTIKNDTATCSNIKTKETKKISFSISVDEDVKAGVYPATLSLLGTSYPVKIQVDSNVVPSALEVGITNNTNFTPGVEKQATFTIQNVGDRDAKNIRMELVNTENVSVIGNSNVKRINLINAKASQSVAMKVRIASNFKGESVAIPIKITYLSSTGEQTEDQQYVYLYTNGTSAASEVTISSVVSPTGQFDVDQNFTVKFNVSAKAPTSNIQITAEGDEGIVPKSQNLFFISKIGAGEVKQYSVTFAATRQAVTSSHPIKIAVTYGTGEDATTVNQYGSVNIVNAKKDADEAKEDEKDEVMKNKPKVIIGEYSINPTIVQAGNQFELTLTFLNTSSEHTVHNLKANILPVEQETTEIAKDTGNVFTPVGGSNTIYIPSLAVGETYTKTLTMYTIPSASAKTYQITVDMAYEDEKGNENTASESLGIPVEQVTKIEIGDIYTEVGTVGIPTALSTTFYNRGRTEISNMMVYIKGDGFEVQENKYFVGTFEIGDSDNYEPTLIANEAGTYTGTLVVEYEDPSGHQQVIEEPFEFVVEEEMMDVMADEEMMMMEEEMETNTNHLWIYITIAVVIIIIVIIIIIILKKKKAKEKEELLDDEDEED